MSRCILFIFYFFIYICFSNLIFATSTTQKSNVFVTSPVTEKYLSGNGPKVVLTRAQLVASGTTSLAQALQNLGGVQLQDSTGNGSQVSISMRGFGTNATSNVLFLINGIPITNPDLAPVNLNNIPLYAIEMIEIVAGSESVLYGDQAVAGIVNIVTRSMQNEKFALSCSGGSYNTYLCYARLAHEDEKLHYNVSLGKRHSANYRNHNQYNQTQTQGLIDYIYNHGQITFNYTIANENMQYPGALTAAQVRENRRQASNNNDYFQDWSTFLHLQHTQTLIHHWTLQTDLMTRQMQGNGVLYSPFNQARHVYFLKPMLKGTWWHTKLNVGADIGIDDYRLTSAYGLNATQQQKYSLYFLSQTPFAQAFTFDLGARGAQQNSYLQSFTNANNLNRAFAANFGISWRQYPWRWFIRQAGSYRFPKADENATAPVGVTALRTQRGLAYETGVHWENNQDRLALQLYQLNLRDEITYDPTQTPLEPFGSNRNLPPTVRRGLSLSGRKEIWNQLYIDGQYNYVNARFKSGLNVGNRIPLVSENILRAGINYAFHQHWNAYLSGIYTGNQYPANDDANITGIMGGYTTFDFNIRYVYKCIEASLHINNIFNKYYYLYTVYQSSMGGDFFYPAPGRNFMLTFNYLMR